ncbi:PIN domain-containing protein [Nostoc sp. LPT]|uniref:type II toxin-antitoxin system VapC family toxin n=1 Tax=Nostoc sp. LPT TaxID=2815387 RepID=UPI0025D969C2|nr:PIN domain-containing protein [Nostoc sp. LPT]
MTEAMYLLGRYGGWLAQQELWSYVIDKLLIISEQTSDNLTRMRNLMEQYRDVPMDLADASLVATAQMLNTRQIFTLDGDFYIYRLWNNSSFEVIP